MTNEEFESLKAELDAEVLSKLQNKAIEYVSIAQEGEEVDRLSNFRIAAELRQTNMVDAVAGMMIKHTVSIYDLIDKFCFYEQNFPRATWLEKITDHIAYLYLLFAALHEEDALQ